MSMVIATVAQQNLLHKKIYMHIVTMSSTIYIAVPCQSFVSTSINYVPRMLRAE